MSKKTKRELWREVADLREERGENILIARCDPVTGDLEDFDGNPIDPDNHGADTLIRYRSVIVMDREQAEQQGRTILGPADVPGDRDVVEVPDGRSTKRDKLPNGDDD